MEIKIKQKKIMNIERSDIEKEEIEWCVHYTGAPYNFNLAFKNDSDGNIVNYALIPSKSIKRRPLPIWFQVESNNVIDFIQCLINHRELFASIGKEQFINDLVDKIAVKMWILN